MKIFIKLYEGTRPSSFSHSFYINDILFYIIFYFHKKKLEYLLNNSFCKYILLSLAIIYSHLLIIFIKYQFFIELLIIQIKFLREIHT